MTIGGQRLINLAETAIAFIISEYFATWTIAAALAAGVVLPNMPLLRHTYLAFVFVLLLMAWVRLRGETWSSFGLVVPRRWLRIIGIGVGLAIVNVVLDGLVRSVSTPFIVGWIGQAPRSDVQMFAELRGNLPLLIMLLPPVWLFAAFGEEFLFRGYLLTRLAQIWGSDRTAWVLAVIGQALAFGLAHFYQGPIGMVPIAVGSLFNGAVAAWTRNLWPLMIAHGLVDTLGFTLLYLGKM